MTSEARIAIMICRREWMRLLRRPAQVVAGLGTPLILWLFLASGFAESMKPEHLGEASSFASFMLPGVMTLVVVFSSIFSAISVIEDRQAGWLQAALVSPAPLRAIISGKIVGGAGVAAVQGVLCLAPAPWLAGVTATASDIALVVAGLALTALAVSALSVTFAWFSESTASFHSVMNLVLMPLWLLSGAFFPASGSAAWLAWVMRLNPLTWCTDALREPLSGDFRPLPLLIALGFAVAMTGLAIGVISRAGRPRRAGPVTSG